jgi:hypothetical protein
MSKFTTSHDRADYGRRIATLERLVSELATERRLERAAVGSGGLRVHGGGSVTLEGGGSLRVDDGGDILAQGGQIIARDTDGDDLFRAGGDPGEVFIRDDILGPLTRQIMGEAQIFDAVEAQGTTSSTDFTDNLSGSDNGPQVTAEVGDTGRALVQIGWLLSSDTSLDHVSMSFRVSGATTQPSSGFRSIQLQFQEPVILTNSIAILVEDLEPGDNTFTAQYKVTTIGATGFFANRWMLVTPY